MALVGKTLPANSGDIRDAGSIPESGRTPGEGHGNPLQYPGLENSMNRETWQATVHGVTKSQTRLSNFHFDRSPELRASSQVTQGDGEGSNNLVFTYTVARTGFGVRIYPRAQPSSVPGGHVSPSISGEAVDGPRVPPAGCFPRAREPSSALSETSHSHSVNICPVAGGPSSSP